MRLSRNAPYSLQLSSDYVLGPWAEKAPCTCGPLGIIGDRTAMGNHLLGEQPAWHAGEGGGLHTHEHFNQLH